MAKRYQRIKGGEKNAKSGTPFETNELERVCDLYVEINGKGIHENNPKIHELGKELGRTIRSVENQLLGFRLVDKGTSGRKNFNKRIKLIWDARFGSIQEDIISLPSVNNSKKKDKNYNSSDFKFRISSKLKDIIGKELITDDFIAVFELVKNSFDAHARNVRLVFEKDKITISDDGKGMDKVDIIDKWLFVAYSAKTDGTEDIEFNEDKNKSYRDKITVKKNFAGAKGIGRFSSDRLGEKLKLISKKITSNSLYWTLDFNWEDFEQDAEEEFVNIPVNHKSSKNSSIQGFEHGVILEISGLRSLWSRDKILKLKSSLEKLINPFANVDQKDGNQTFDLEIICEREKDKDELLKQAEEYNPRDIVNGTVKNFVFEALDIKTTKIVSEILGEKLITKLIDRGNLIYEIEESLVKTGDEDSSTNPYYYIPNGSKIQLYYLNQPAKNNFTRLMGIQSVNFGSIFLFNNGFRVFPVGEPGDDSYDLEIRKGQGFARYIGTRELIGSIEILGQSEHFVESSSRDGGLIDGLGTQQLRIFLIETLRKLERFVEPILWKIKKRTGSIEERIDSEAKNQVIELVDKLTGGKNVKLLNYSKDFLNIIDDKTAISSLKVFDQLRSIAEKTQDPKFINDIDSSELEYLKLKKEKEAEGQRRIEAEEKAKEAEERAEKAKEKAEQEKVEKEKAELKAFREKEAKEKAEKDLNTEKLKAEFFRKQLTPETDVLVHHIKNDSISIKTTIENILQDLNDESYTKNELIKDLSHALLHATKAIKAANIITHVELSESESQHVKLEEFLSGYVEHYQEITNRRRTQIVYEHEGVSFNMMLSKTEMAIVIDNLEDNAEKWGAKNILIKSRARNSKEFVLHFSDDGKGLSEKYFGSTEQVFEFGETNNEMGTGLGLHIVKEILDKMGADIKFTGNNHLLSGACFEITFKR